MAVRLISIGHSVRDPLYLAAGEYLARITRHVPFEDIALEPAKRSKGADDQKVRALEAAAIFKAAKGYPIVALDQRGRSYTSEKLAAKFQAWLSSGDFALVIGGATGLHQDVLSKSREKLSLGPLTLPHRLARLVLCEQLYRALTILRGEPYHK